MPIPTDLARALITDLQAPQIQNLFNQAHAKYVLHEVKEVPENFPSFTADLDDRVTFAAYSLLAAGCSLVEQGQRSEGNGVLEQAASQLQYIHGPHAVGSREHSFHLFVGAMAFYAAGHYSRAFVAVRSVEEQTTAARIIGAFLRKDMSTLGERLDEVLLRETPDFEEQAELDEWAITVAIARSVSYAMEFIRIGQEDLLPAADEQLRNAGIIASVGNYPAWWWIVRLLRLMLQDLNDASPWRVLPPRFGSDATAILGDYIKLHAFSDRPVAELWTSQRVALPLALNLSNHGAVINLRTSAGKTRIAELAILQTLLAHPNARVFYLAPFRSLAFEVEHTLAAIFTRLGFGVSHLYGGSRVSSVDAELAAESMITIATPEKARALFRAMPELFQDVKLIIVDEGHLIGRSDRDIRNEIFLDHLRLFARKKGARILLLSAVLPNAQQMAEWVAGDSDAVIKSDWKPSTERFGFLRWKRNRVKLEWQGREESWNESFVKANPVEGRTKHFPDTKTEAVAASAVRLSELGPVMIFAGQARWVNSMARAVLLALGEKTANHPWPEYEWKVFESVCREEMAADDIELEAARAGVICHSNRLSAQTRLAIEQLMRTTKPKIIIATTTLAQGVNVGISSVIVSTSSIGEKLDISKKDFWNICGRAGRAFVDGEGKILYAIDDTKDQKSRFTITDQSLDGLKLAGVPDRVLNNLRRIKERKFAAERVFRMVLKTAISAQEMDKFGALILEHADKNVRKALDYFFSGSGDSVESGLLWLTSQLRQMASQAKVSFDLLLDIAASNDFSTLGENASKCHEICDLLDDELLALHTDPIVNPEAEDPTIWVEKVFRESLAAIQARSGISGIGSEDLLSFLRARAESVLLRVEESARRAIVSSGLPLNVALQTQVNLDVFRKIADAYSEANGELQVLVAGVREIEEWARTYAISVVIAMPQATKFDSVRQGWLEGVGIQKLAEDRDSAKKIPKKLLAQEKKIKEKIIKKIYGEQLPWIIHAASQQLRQVQETEQAEALAKIALLVELGVPTVMAARIFLAGVRSRAAATELANLNALIGSKISEIRNQLQNAKFANQIRSKVSSATASWLDLIIEETLSQKQEVIPRFGNFKLPNADDFSVLQARKRDGHIILCTVDGRSQFPVQATEDLPFNLVANDPRYAFVRSGDIWQLTFRDPRLSSG